MVGILFVLFIVLLMSFLGIKRYDENVIDTGATEIGAGNHGTIISRDNFLFDLVKVWIGTIILLLQHVLCLIYWMTKLSFISGICYYPNETNKDQIMNNDHFLLIPSFHSFCQNIAIDGCTVVTMDQNELRVIEKHATDHVVASEASESPNLFSNRI